MTTASLADAERLSAEAAAPALPADSLALGMVFLLGLTVAQRFVGLLRNVLFCRLLDEDQLGLWSLGFSFLVLAAPLAVLGLPGSFGRYLEYYRRRGQLRDFLRRTTWASLSLGAAAAAAVCLAPASFSWFIYADPSHATLVLCLGVALALAIGFNFLAELLTALRQVRTASLMQFVHSLVFTAVGLGLLCATSRGASALVGAYAAACLVAGLLAAPLLWRMQLGEAAASVPLAHKDVWLKLLPFAAWTWAINLLANLCDVADRYVVLHFSGLDVPTALGLVGQLHSSRVVPVLMVGVATLVGGAILPYLSHDWEAGQRNAVSARLNLAIKLLGLACTAGSAVLLVSSPLLFGWVLQGRYDGGLSILPLSLLACVWLSLGMLSYNYLLCAERIKFGTLAFFVALACNVTLNITLLPVLGLVGAALATAIANAMLLSVILALNLRLGMRIDLGTWLVCLTPLLLLLGPWPSAIAVLLLAVIALWSTWFFSEEEKQELIELASRITRRGKPVTTSDLLNPEP